MKKLLYTLATLAALAFAAGCAREVVGTDAVNGDTVEGTFTIALPENVATRAISDGTGATQLLFMAYDTEGKMLTALSQDDVTVSGYNATVTVSLIKGVTYDFTFWAQTQGKYTIANDGTITITPADMMNDDSYDAFYARVEDYLVTGPFNESLTLTRPFAQVNVGAPQDDITAAKASGLAVNETLTSGYTINVANKFNLLDGTVDGADDVTLTKKAHITSQKLKVGDDTYEYVAMAYVLMPEPNAWTYDATADALVKGTDTETKSTLESLGLDIYTLQNGSIDINLDRKVYNVPVQRNYRTNILGNIFSVEGTFNILVDQNFGGEDYLPEYADIAALNAAFAKTGATDADKWSYKVKVLAAGDTKEIKLPVTTDPVDIVFADGAFESEEISIVYGDTADGAAKPKNLTLYTGKLAKLTATVPATHVDLVNGSDITDAEVSTSNTTFVVKAGAHVTNLKINAGGLVIEAAAEGSALEDGEVENITVDVNADVTIPENFEGTVEYFGDIESQAALEKALAGGGEFIVMADIDTDAQFVVPAGKTVVLDMNGKTISNTKDIWAGNSWSLISVQGGELTIKGDGKFLAKEDDEYAADVRKGGKLVIENGTFVGNISAVYVYDGGTLEVKGGTFDIKQLANGSGEAQYRYMLNCRDEYYVNGTAKIIVTGGKFHMFNPANNAAEGAGTNFLADGYMTTVSTDEGGSTWYTVEEGAVELTGIEITSAPTKKDYFVGDEFVADGLVVTAKYNNNTSEPVTDYTTDAAEVLAAAGEDKDVTVTYQEKTATFKVNVTAVALESIAVTTPPTKTTYTVGETIDLTDMVITATNNNGSTFEVTEGYTTDAEAVLAEAGTDKAVTVTYQEKTATFTVTVNEAPYVYVGAGTAEDPYTVADVRHYIDALENPTTGSSGVVYVKGIVVELTQYKYSTSTRNPQDSNFWIADSATSEEKFEAYAIKYFNSTYVAGYKDIEEGDEVVVAGKVKLYSETTYETTGDANSVLYKLNGETAVPETPTISTPENVTEIAADEGSNLTVSIAAATGLSIYYTTDGTTPTVESTLYEDTFDITAACTVKAIAAKIEDGKVLVTSAIASKEYTKAGETYEWVETAAEDLNTGDVVVISYLVSEKYYAANHGELNSSGAPKVTEISVENNKAAAPADALQWTVNVTDDGYQFMSGSYYLYGTATNNGMKVGTTKMTFAVVKAGDSVGGGNYLKFTDSKSVDRYVGVYETTDVRCYTSVNNNIKNQALVFFVKTLVEE